MPCVSCLTSKDDGTRNWYILDAQANQETFNYLFSVKKSGLKMFKLFYTTEKKNF